jgi:Fe-S cluster assembly protein SufD
MSKKITNHKFQEYITEKEDFISINIPKGVRIKEILTIDRINSKLDINITINESSSLNLSVLQESLESCDINVLLKDNAEINTTINTKVTEASSCSYVAKVGNKSHSNIEWIFQTEGNEELNLYCENFFAERDSSGDITIKGVLADMSKVKVKGIINIDKKGAKTDAYLKEDILLLDDGVVIEAIPKLIIDTNDVKASHGVAISNISKDQLFYFSSRGIDESEAKKMIVDGFLKKID